MILFSISTLFAQRDTEHWFAPMAARSSVLSSPQQALYFSTDSTTPFPVQIYNNNTVIGTVTISKGNPQTFNVPLNNIITSDVSNLFTPNTMGIYTKGEKPYFVTLRFSVSSHGEILTSKGKAGIGTKFYAVVSPIEYSTTLNNFTTGIMATENNTTVTVSNYGNNVTFTNGWTSATNPTLTFTLNKGESYIIEGIGNLSGNKTGFIGAKIQSNKPISVTNGNFNGNFALTGSFDGTDIIMDQSVPVDRLGDEFVVVKGMGNISERMEDALIVATENGTQVYINGSTTPAATLNEGQFYRVNQISNTNYINQGNDHYNMHIKTTKNVYVYQLLAGVATSNATVGFNYIPPLNCFLPRKIDEIGFINILPPTTNSVKLNILTEAGATVLVDNLPVAAANGPFNVTGTPNWVSYSIPNVTGNKTITSTKAVTAGISGGSGVVGYGGYFAGFSSIPLISKSSGECIPGLVLEVDDSYETYQWYRNGIAITGATSHTYTPTLAGIYTAVVSVGSCAPATTPEYKVYTCLHESTATKNVCEGYLNIVPAFTNSSQTYLPGSVQIITPPAHGTAIINPITGVIGYTPTYGYVGTDKIIYKFCGNDPNFPDCEQITLTINIAESPIVNDAVLRTCFLPTNTATGQFDLTTAVVNNQNGTTLKYYPSLTDANNDTNEILNPTVYIAPTGVVYVRVTNANGCYKVAKITLIVFPPTKSNVLSDVIICMEDTATVDAGPGFDGYLWDNGATTQSTTGISVGYHYVDLISGTCTTRQYYNVYASEQPVVSSIDVSTTNATVNVVGGTAPYKYSLDNIIWQDSNVFTNLPRGDIKIYVKDSYNCNPLEFNITIPNLINVITPNGDGINDVLDYSALASKPGLTFTIFDRYGTKLFEGTKDNNYKWDGTIAGKKISTGNYWYTITWSETNRNNIPLKYSGWILVKNRE